MKKNKIYILALILSFSLTSFARNPPVAPPQDFSQGDTQTDKPKTDPPLPIDTHLGILLLAGCMFVFFTYSPLNKKVATKYK